jgi:hypothetical protein
MAVLPFIGPSYQLDSRPASVQRTINMRPVPIEPGNERTPWVFKDVPGLTFFAAPVPLVQPVLHMHFDGDAIDETGITTFGLAGVYTFPDNGDFNEAVHATNNARWAGTSTQDLAIGTRKWTIEGRSMFTGAELGGVVIAKNYYATEPAPGVFEDDWAVGVSPTALTLTWTGAVEEYSASFAATLDEEFSWAITDDGINCRFYKDGVLIQTEPSVSLDGVPPPVNAGSRISVLNKLQGFSGGAPDWSNTFYRGQLDELRVFIGDTTDYALYRESSYEVATGPFPYPNA